MSVRPHDAAPTSPEGDDAEDNRAHVLERIETLLHEVSFLLTLLTLTKGVPSLHASMRNCVTM